jgi:high affinity Mn2+ porin
MFTAVMEIFALIAHLVTTLVRVVLPGGVQTIDTGDERDTVEGVANQLRGSRSFDRWVFTLGKFGVTDIFDTNQYAHDPRSDFLNWSAVDAGAFDYAADAWGYTVGAAAERYQGSWTLRAGVFDLSNIPNSTHLDPGFHEFQIDAEIEKRYELFGQTGRVLLTGFDCRGRMALLDETISLAQATGVNINTALVDTRQYRSRCCIWHHRAQQSTTKHAKVPQQPG